MSALEVAAVVVVLVVGASILWSTVRYGMPPMPSLGRSRQVMLELVPDAPDGAIVDLGSGWGTLAWPFARRFPQTPVIGYEISLFPWLFSVLMAKLLRQHNLRFYRRDFRRADLSGASVVLCYLAGEGMESVARMLEGYDPEQPLWLISHHFALPGHEPETVMRLNDLFATPLYRYRINKQ